MNTDRSPQRRRQIDCWNYWECGRGPGSADACEAATAVRLHGINHGRFGGRLCWSVVGILSGCDETPPGCGSDDCASCPFMLLVQEEEGRFDFVLMPGLDHTR